MLAHQTYKQSYKPLARLITRVEKIIETNKREVTGDLNTEKSHRVMQWTTQSNKLDDSRNGQILRT